MKKFVSLYITSTRNGGEPITTEEHNATVQKVAAEFSKAFGGATLTQGQGCWMSDTKGLIVEPVTIVKSYHDTTEQDALAVALPLAQWLKVEFNQEAVSLETDNGLEFI